MKENNNAEIYGFYTILYVNDLACNYIKQIKYLIPNEDKEARKIFGALEKRYKRYFRTINNLCGEGNVFIADYSSKVDEIIFVDKKNYIQLVKESFSEKDSLNAEYYTRIEIARSFLDLSISTIESICNDFLKQGIKYENLKTYRLLQLRLILKDFTKWAYRKINFNINFNDIKSVTDSFMKFTNKLFDYRTFEKAYEYAVNLEKQDKKI